jgi:hypothetical protein
MAEVLRGYDGSRGMRFVSTGAPTQEPPAPPKLPDDEP